MSDTKVYDWRTNPAPYIPYSKRMILDPDPQRNPEWFTSADIRKEITMLLRMNRKYGTHHLRVAAYLRLDEIVKHRNGL